jgi:hypothetical protein
MKSKKFLDAYIVRSPPKAVNSPNPEDSSSTSSSFFGGMFRRNSGSAGKGGNVGNGSTPSPVSTGSR